MDEAGGAVVRGFVDEARSRGRGLMVVTHDRSLLDVVDTVVDLE
jgi:ABC-type lipoprotein export system ATPase subunit